MFQEGVGVAFEYGCYGGRCLGICVLEDLWRVGEIGWRVGRVGMSDMVGDCEER